MFESNVEFNNKIRRDGGEVVEALTRYPTAAEWSEWFRGRKSTITNLGRGMSEVDIDTAEADQKLYLHIKLNGAPELHPLEAKQIVDELSRADVAGVEAVDANQVRVDLRCMFGIEVSHVLRIPGVRAVGVHRAAQSKVVNLPYGRTQVKTLLEPSVTLWDAIQVSVEGYPSLAAVPPVHKDASVRALLQWIDEQIGEEPGSEKNG